jgi:hypothetical protein
MTGRTPDSIWRRVRRARLFRVLAVYLSVSFVVLQAVGLFTDKLGLPDWFFPGALALLLIGLPIIVATALVQSVSSDDRPHLSATGSGARDLDADALAPVPHTPPRPGPARRARVARGADRARRGSWAWSPSPVTG